MNRCCEKTKTKGLLLCALKHVWITFSCFSRIEYQGKDAAEMLPLELGSISQIASKHQEKDAAKIFLLELGSIS